MKELFIPSKDAEEDSKHFGRIAQLVFNSIGFMSDTFVTEFILWIYYKEYDPEVAPNNLLSLPGVTTGMPFAMGDRIMIDPKINDKWQMMAGPIANFPYDGRRTVPVIVVVKDDKEGQELIDALNARYGLHQQEESLHKQMDQREISQTDL